MTVLVLPVTAIDNSPVDPLSPQQELLQRIRWAISDCLDDEMPAIASLLKEAADEINRLQGSGS